MDFVLLGNINRLDVKTLRSNSYKGVNITENSLSGILTRGYLCSETSLEIDLVDQADWEA